MSKHMQLTVRIRPYYKNGLKGIYPNIASELARVGSPWDEEDLSLFDIVAKLDKLLYEAEGISSLRKILLEHQGKLRILHENIEACIADWKLAQADKMLYQIEDIFEDIESELDGIQ